MGDTIEFETTIFNVEELAVYLKCSQSTIRKLLRNREIPNYRIGHRIFFRKNMIDAWIQNKCLQSCEGVMYNA